MNLKKWRKRILAVLAIGTGLCILINLGVLLVGGRDISQPDDVGNLKNADCILVLGCQVKEDGSPSHMLQDRLERAIELYNNQGIRTKLLMSGDHGTEGYNEVATMRQYALDRGVPSQDIFMDHAGFSTYESLFRAKHIVPGPWGWMPRAWTRTTAAITGSWAGRSGRCWPESRILACAFCGSSLRIWAIPLICGEAARSRSTRSPRFHLHNKRECPTTRSGTPFFFQACILE